MKILRLVLWVMLTLGIGTFDLYSLDLMVISHSSNTVGALSKHELKQLFSGETLYIGDQKVSTYLSSDPQMSQAVLDRVYELPNRSILKKMWLKKLYRGDVFVKPAILGDANAVIESVKSTPGAVGIVPKQSIAGVKVVQVDGNPFL